MLSRWAETSLVVCVLVVWAVYTGNLTASLAVQTVQWPFRDLAGLAQADDYTLLMAEGTLREDLFRVSGTCVHAGDVIEDVFMVRGTCVQRW